MVFVGDVTFVLELLDEGVRKFLDNSDVQKHFQENIVSKPWYFWKDIVDGDNGIFNFGRELAIFCDFVLEVIFVDQLQDLVFRELVCVGVILRLEFRIAVVGGWNDVVDGARRVLVDEVDLLLPKSWVNVFNDNKFFDVFVVDSHSVQNIEWVVNESKDWWFWLFFWY